MGTKEEEPKEILFKRITLNWKKKETKEIAEIPSKRGLYQIYGTSPVYGMDTLLYIGMGENLQKRINDHISSEKSFIGRQPNKTIRYAEFPQEVESSLLAITEQILIVMYKPSFNSSSVINIKDVDKAKYYYIQNRGERGILSMEVTNYYFIKPNIFPTEE
jgi:excinuclease UvrABC nuclease subunit